MEPRKATLPTTFSATGANAMRHLLRLSPLPESSPVNLPQGEDEWKLGMPLRILRELKHTLETTWSYEELERRMRLDDNHVVDILIRRNGADDDGEVLKLHFLHCPSKRQEAIPLLLLHGWPGTAFDYHKVIDALTNPSDGSLPSYVP